MPAAGNVAVEVGEAALEKDTPVPPTCVQVEVTVAPEGSPSSVTVPARVTLLVGSVIVLVERRRSPPVPGSWTPPAAP